jgi:hypothetical protein
MEFLHYTALFTRRKLVSSLFRKPEMLGSEGGKVLSLLVCK